MSCSPDAAFEFASNDENDNSVEVVLSTLISSFKISMPANGKDIIWNMAGVRYPTVGESVKPAFPMRMERLVDADSEFKSQDE